jgi:hypothetical protein
MTPDDSHLLRRLYNVPSNSGVTTGSVLITRDLGARGSAKLDRLDGDLREVVSQSGFHVSRNPNPGLIAEIVLGAARPRSAAQVITADYEGWAFRVARTPLEDCSDVSPPNPITSLLVAGIVTSEIFRSRFERETVWRPTAGCAGVLCAGSGAAALPPSMLDFQGDPIAFLGCGSISFAAVHALDSVKKVDGTFVFVDPGSLSASNRRKYLSLRGIGGRGGKADALRRVLSTRGLRAEARRCSVNEYGRDVAFRIPLAVTSVDSSIARRDVQAKLPRTVLNAWTGGAEDSLFAGASRHSFDGTEECLNCAYWSDTEGEVANLVELALRLGTSSQSLFRKRREGEPFPEARGAKSSPEGRFLDGYVNACENLTVAQGSVRREFSIPFVAAIGGALLAFALVAEGSPDLAAFRSYRLRRNFSMASSFSAYFEEPAASRRGCLCQDDNYRAVYAEKWGGSPAMLTE